VTIREGFLREVFKKFPKASGLGPVAQQFVRSKTLGPYGCHLKLLERKGGKFAHIATCEVGPHSNQIIAHVLPAIEAVSDTDLASHFCSDAEDVSNWPTRVE
jgi:hypothetical protein